MSKEKNIIGEIKMYLSKKTIEEKRTKLNLRAVSE